MPERWTSPLTCENVLAQRLCAAGSFAETVLREGVVVDERH